MHISGISPRLAEIRGGIIHSLTVIAPDLSEFLSIYVNALGAEFFLVSLLPNYKEDKNEKGNSRSGNVLFSVQRNKC